LPLRSHPTGDTARNRGGERAFLGLAVVKGVLHLRTASPYAPARPTLACQHVPLCQRLGDVLISTVFQCKHLIHGTIPCGHEDDGHFRKHADPTTPVEPVVVGEVDVRRYQVRPQRFHFVVYVLQVLTT
jgi:hypothetical protein